MALPPTLFHFAAPKRLHALAGRWVRPCLWLALALLLPGLWLALVATPADAVQGEGYRMLYVHVPAAWMSMWIYAAIAFWSFVGLVWRTRASHLMAHALAPTGAVFAFLSLATGALWGKPMWGTWWVWDARLTTSLLLLFIYLGYLALLRAHEGRASADRPCAVLGLLGALNLPVIYFSVHWWNTLHQGASITPGGASMPTATLAGLLLMAGAAWAWTCATAFKRVQLLIEEREAHTRWLQALQQPAEDASFSIATRALPAGANR
ncbi:MAG: heme ABC transporter permease CcmC [Pseudomonadota bacterium]|nr:heme ABC transporter permease CcmC [Pseudomonadota bacterium]